MTSWRDRARPIIAKVLADTAGKPEKEINPYRIWCDEIRAQRGLKPKKKGGYDGDTRDLFDARAKGLV